MCKATFKPPHSLKTTDLNDRSEVVHATAGGGGGSGANGRESRRAARRPHRPQVAQITAFVTRLHETVSIFHADLRELSRGFAFSYPKNTQHLILIQHE